jgi:transcriptional regulator with XRE-family HTH domain
MTPLHQRIKDRGLTAAQLAREAGVSDDTVYRVLASDTPSLAVGLRLARALGSTVEVLFGHVVDRTDGRRDRHAKG